MGLRTKSGVSLTQARALYSPLDDVSVPTSFPNPQLLDWDAVMSCVEKGFVSVSGPIDNLSRVAPTEKGLAVIDSILVEILKA